jgi:hypothetical protein
VLKKVQEAIEQEPLNSRVVDYYLETAEATSDKRIQRIVREQLKAASLRSTTASTSTTTTTSSAASKVIQNQLRYARKRTPEERRQAKMSEFAEISEDADEDDVMPSKKSRKTTREATLEAQNAHTEMCKKATAGITLMELRILNKLDRKIDDM